MRISFSVSLLILALSGFSQINMLDSTIQVIGYWSKNETEKYVITQQKFTIKGLDTSISENLKYYVDISVTDSTPNSYTIDWFYHDYEITSDNELAKKVMSIAKDMTVTIKTDEFGAFAEVVNWKELRDYIYKGTKLLKKETSNIPNMDEFISQIESQYSTKESIEASAIKEIHQFYTYHGAKYKLGEEITASMKSPNLYGSEPFDTDVVLWLDELNPDDDNAIIRMTQTVNSEQLTETTFDYLTKMAETLKVPAPVWETFPPLENVIYTASRLHGSGWVIYTVETREVSAEGVITVEERIIEIL